MYCSPLVLWWILLVGQNVVDENDVNRYKSFGFALYLDRHGEPVIIVEVSSLL